MCILHNWINESPFRRKCAKCPKTQVRGRSAEGWTNWKDEKERAQ